VGACQVAYLAAAGVIMLLRLPTSIQEMVCSEKAWEKEYCKLSLH